MVLIPRLLAIKYRMSTSRLHIPFYFKVRLNDRLTSKNSCFSLSLRTLSLNASHPASHNHAKADRLGDVLARGGNGRTSFGINKEVLRLVDVGHIDFSATLHFSNDLGR